MQDQNGMLLGQIGLLDSVFQVKAVGYFRGAVSDYFME